MFGKLGERIKRITNMKRDLSEAQFEYRATKAGFKTQYFMGYWQLAQNPSVHVSVWNAGKRNRDRLRYLFACDKRETQRREKEALSKAATDTESHR